MTRTCNFVIWWTQLLIFIAGLSACFCQAQGIAWNFDGLSGTPAAWESEWDRFNNCENDPPTVESCDLENLPWGALLGELQPPSYVPMDSMISTPAFTALGNDAQISISIRYNLSELSGPGRDADQLDIELVTIVQGIPDYATIRSYAIGLGDIEQLRNDDRADNEEGVENGVAIITHDIGASQAGATYRLRTRAADFDEDPTFGSLGLDDFYVANASLAGDADADGTVVGVDLLAWQQGHGIASGAAAADGDANRDGAVNSADLMIWEEQFGAMAVIVPPAPSARTVPEPGAAGLTLALIGLLLRRAK